MKSANEKVCHALWTSATSGYILLGEDWQDDDIAPPVFLGPVKRTFRSLERARPEEFGKIGRYYKKGRRWFFTLRPERYPNINFKKTSTYVAGDFNGWAEAVGKEEWHLRWTKDPLGDGKILILAVPQNKLRLDRPSRFKFVTADGVWLEVPDAAPNWVRERNGIGNLEFNPRRSGRHIFRFETPEGFDPVGNEEVLWIDGKVRESEPFPPTDRLLEATTDYRMGVAIVPGKSTTFRIFAPRAKSVHVVISRSSSMDDAQHIPLSRLADTAWEVEIDDDLTGAYYLYHIDGSNSTGTTFFDPEFPVVDPYAVALVGREGPGIVLDRDRLPRPEKLHRPPPWHELVILECHLRDLITHSPLPLSQAERRGFTGMRRCMEASVCYLRELGINAIEFQPLQEFDNRTREEYHWGYMPVNFFAPESSFGTKPERASQIEELQQLVATCHDNGIAVIVDVVYNHVGEPNHLLFIDKFYYFNLSDDYSLMNWSGCGNDLRCDTPMGRRLVVESLKHWIEVFDVDGFRFDLAELVGADVLEEVERELKKVKPGVILIAEPWSFRGHIQEELKATGFASWSDGFRKFLPDYVCGQGNQDGIRYFLSGSPTVTRFAAQVINYTESHDDRCWIDSITERPENDGLHPTPLDRTRTHLMAAILFSSLGVPMLSAGQDFLRTKRGVNNTYQRGDLNALDFNRRHAYSGSHEYFARWIEFRRSPLGRALCYDGRPGERYLQCFSTEGKSAIAAHYNADRSVDAPSLLFAVNPHFDYAVIPTPGLKTCGAIQIADQERFDERGLSRATISLADHAIHLPPMSCGLWILANETEPADKKET